MTKSWPVLASFGVIGPPLGGLPEMELDMPKLMGRPNHPSHQGKGIAWYLLRQTDRERRHKQLKINTGKRLQGRHFFSAISSTSCQLGVQVASTCPLQACHQISDPVSDQVNPRIRFQINSIYTYPIYIDFSAFYFQNLDTDRECNGWINSSCNHKSVPG